MTDPTPDPLDVLASAHLDGVDADGPPPPEVAGRVAAFRRAREALREPVEPLPAAVREAQLSAALAAFDEARDEAADGYERGRRVVPLAGRRRLARPAWARAVAVAAAAVAVAALAPLLLDGDDGGDEVASEAADAGTTTADAGDGDRTMAADAPPAVPDAAVGGTGGPAGTGSEALEATARGSAVDLGRHAALDDLVAAARPLLPPAAATAAAAGEPGPAQARCLDRAHGTATGPIVLAATATLAGRPVVVVVVDEPGAGRTLRVLDSDADCAAAAAVLHQVALDPDP